MLRISNEKPCILSVNSSWGLFESGMPARNIVSLGNILVIPFGVQPERCAFRKDDDDVSFQPRSCVIKCGESIPDLTTCDGDIQAARRHARPGVRAGFL